MEKVLFKLTQTELNFLLRFVPAFGEMGVVDKQVYTSIMGKLAAKQGSLPTLFKFPKDKNNAVQVIKFIRGQLDVGLKEAKDMWDAETTFSLTEWKMSIEMLEQAIWSYDSNIQVEFL